MALVQFKSKKKPTGGTYKRIRKKKKRDFGSDFIPTKIGPTQKKIVEGLANIKKLKLFQVDKANVFDSSGKAHVVKIISVKKNPANPHFERMGVITKGAIIETEIGLAKVVSRPGQDGVVNAIKIEEKK
ncbi:MAG: 30S ribosomal protein S8e [Candidatus Aenigmatarchaeota archaeon]